ncbi:kinase-like protein [Calocera viscosa TUFC12733]|uniref:Kinase-like protein n=1 Tax=Calocera viscosa (strain TUFC12733) TaxID=1330018 RepID=A0A167LH33_CALVF|nr:kinase-like protein [Calocera viscosa TUFC12733]
MRPPALPLPHTELTQDAASGVMAPTSRMTRAQAKRLSQNAPQQPSVMANTLDTSFEPGAGAAAGTPSWGRLMGQGFKLVDLYTDKLAYHSRDILRPTDSSSIFLQHFLPLIDFEIAWTGNGIPGYGKETRRDGGWSIMDMHFTIRNYSPHTMRAGRVDIPSGTAAHIVWGQTIQVLDPHQSNVPAEFLQIAFVEPNFPTSAPAPSDAFEAEYSLSKPINSGQFGTVFYATHKRSNEGFAVKRIKKKLSLMTDADLANIERECDIMHTMANHANVVHVHRTFMSADHLYIVMEYVRGEELLKKIQDAGGGLDEEDTRFIMKRLISGMAHVHSENIAHRDLKPENILITSDYPPGVKIVDFGMAKHAHSRTALTTHCGTQIYAAPEVFSKEIKSYGLGVDVWSIGVIMFTALTGNYPWTLRSNAQQNWSPSASTMEWERLRGRLSDEGQDLLRRMLVDDPRQRIELKYAISHPWLAPEHSRPHAILATRTTSFVHNAPLTPESQRSGSLPTSNLHGAQQSSVGVLQTLTSAGSHMTPDRMSTFAMVMPGGLPIDQSSRLLTPLPSLGSSAPPPAGPQTPTRSSDRLKGKKTSSLPRTRSSSNMPLSAKRKAQAASRPKVAVETLRIQTKGGGAGRKKRGLNPALAV